MNSLATDLAAGEERPATASFDHEGWTRITATGVFRTLADTNLSQADRIRETATRMKAFGRAGENPGLLFAVATHLASTITAVTRFGSDDLKEELVPRLVTGESIGAHAITEATAGSDASAMLATAVVDDADGSVILQGHKIFITNAPIATHIVVYARTYRSGEDQGISAYVVDTTWSGVVTTAKYPTASLPDSPIGEVDLENVKVPQTWRLGGEGAGLQILDFVMKREIVYAFSADLGRIERRIDDCVAFANSRQQFNSRLATYQSVSFTIAEMYIDCLAGTAMINEILRRIAENRDITKEVAAAKVVISDANLKTAVDASQILGGKGVQAGSDSVQAVLDALAGPIYSGTNRIQKTRIAAMLGLLTDG
jgi:alkylation response protein AidB-like acyl-CoA dehydrogenase